MINGKRRFLLNNVSINKLFEEILESPLEDTDLKISLNPQTNLMSLMNGDEELSSVNLTDLIGDTEITKESVENLGFIDSQQVEDLITGLIENSSLSVEDRQDIIDEAIQSSNTNLDTRLNTDIARKSEIPTATLPNANLTSGLVDDETTAPSNRAVTNTLLLNKFGNLPWITVDSLKPNLWTTNANASVSDGNLITLTNNTNNQPNNLRASFPKTTVNGERYLFVANIENLVKFVPEATTISVYNRAQFLMTIDVTTGKTVFVTDFISTDDAGSLQFIINRNGNFPTTPQSVIEFRSDFVGLLEYSDELRDFFIGIERTYTQSEDINLGKVQNANFANALTEGADVPFDNSSFETIKPLYNQLTGEIPETRISRWESVTQRDRGVVEGEVVETQVGDSVLREYVIAATVDRDLVNPRYWVGFRILPELYADRDRSFALYLKGTVSTTNGSNLDLRASNRSPITIVRDLIDGEVREFEVVVPINYIEGTSDNSQFNYFFISRTDSQIADVQFDIRFTNFSIFDANEALTISDYASADATKIVVPKILPTFVASKDFVNSRILEISKINLNPSDLKFKYDIEAIWTHGQSLAVGGTASDQSTDFKNTVSFIGGSQIRNRPFTTQQEKDTFFGSGFVLLEENNTNEQYPPAVASTVSVLTLIENENSVNIEDFGGALMPFTTGLSGSRLETMNKGTQPYDNALSIISKAVEFTTSQGKTFAVRVLNFVQGEANSTDEEQVYYDLLSQFFIDFNTDVKAITGQVEDVKFITYQTSAWRGRPITSGNLVLDHINVQNAQLRVVNDFPNVYLSGAMYQFEYGDSFHPLDRGVVGIQQGITYKRLINDESTWTTFQPVSHRVIDNGSGTWFIQLEFEAPVLPIRFDVTGRIHHNPRGKQPNFGFKVFNSSDVNIISQEPFITRGNTVVIPVNENPAGSIIWYAEDGHQGGGNLCDSQNITIVNKGIEYNVDNFCVSFDNYIVN